MNKNNFKNRHLFIGIGLLSGSVMFVFAMILLFEHLIVLKEIKTVSVPLVAKLAELERKKSTLYEQVELSQINAATKVGSLGEKLDTYVLPKETDLDRLIATIELFSEWLRNQNLISEMSEITFEDPVKLKEDGVTVRTIRIKFSANEDGIKKLIAFTQLAGLLTVSDVLTDNEIKTLFSGTEKENPAGIIALEQFLSSDLLRYSQDVRSYEDQLKRSFSSTTFSNLLEKTTNNSLLKDARSVFGGEYGKVLINARLWPIQFITIKEVMIKKGGAEGWYTLGLELLIWEKNK